MVRRRLATDWSRRLSYFVASMALLSVFGCGQQQSPLIREMNARYQGDRHEKVVTTDIAQSYVKLGASESEAVRVLQNQGLALYRKLPTLPSDERAAPSQYYLSYLSAPAIPFFVWNEYWVAIGVTEGKVDFVYSEVDQRYF